MLIFSKTDIKNVSLTALILAGLFLLFSFFNFGFLNIFMILISGPLIVLVQKDGSLVYTLSRLLVGSLIFGITLIVLGFLQHWGTNRHILEEAIKMFSQLIIFYFFLSFFTGLIAILIKGSISLCHQKFKKQ